MRNPFAKTYLPAEEQIFKFLSEIPVFSGLTNKEMAEFLPYMHERQYGQNEAVFLRNDPSHAMYLLQIGEVTLSIEVNNNMEELTKLTNEKAIGVNCLLKNSKRQLNAVVTSENAVFYVIPQVNFFDIFEHKPAIKIKMMEALANSYNDYNARLYKTYKSYFGFFELRHMY